MALADVSPILAALGGVGGIAAAVRWWLDRSERLRREDLAREEARHAEDKAAARELGASLAASAAAVTRVADAMNDLVPRVVRIEERLLATDRTGEHRSAGGAS